MAWLKLVQRNHLMEMRGFFLFPMYCFHAKFLPPSHSLSALLYWVGLKLHSTIWKKIEFITIQLPYFGRKKECGGFFLQNYCKPRSFPIFWPEIKKSMGLGKSKYKENLKNYSLHMTSGWKSLHGLIQQASYKHGMGAQRWLSANGSPWSAATSTNHRVLFCYPGDD